MQQRKSNPVVHLELHTGDLAGAWNEVPESHVGIVQPGEDELRPFTPRA